MNGILEQNFVFTFSAFLIPFWIKVMPGRGFIIFRIFLLFFSEFSCTGRVWRYSWVKFCFQFFGLSPPVLAKNNAGRRYYYYLNFLEIFFGIFFPGSSMNGILEQNFIFSFSAYLLPFWLKITPGRGFIIFWIFLLFFSEFSIPDRVWTGFWSKILFSLFWLISSRLG